MLAHAPRFDQSRAARIVRDLYGVDGSARTLPSERDQNFLIAPSGAEPFVLKIANALEERSLIEAQQLALAHVSNAAPLFPRVIPTQAGLPLAEIDAGDGRRHLVWAVTRVPGVPLASVRRRPSELLDDFGSHIGALDTALCDFDHPAIHRELHWDLACGRQVIDTNRRLISDPDLAAAIDVLVERFDRFTAGHLPQLRRSAIHNDLNDHNVLVSGGGDSSATERRVVGIVDFGDMVHSYTVGDLAIAAAYVVLGADDPHRALAGAAAVVRGYHRRYPLDEDELAALFGLIVLRLCTSACVAAQQRPDRPDNEYLDVSQAAIRRMLPALASIPFGLAEAVFREACGLEPVRASARVRAWLAAHTTEMAPVIDSDLRREPCLVLDLSVGSALVSGDERENAEPLLSSRIAAELRSAGVPIGVGRYDEPRLLYTSSIFGDERSETAERRTIHIGLDLFAPAGTLVRAPLEGVIHAFADNAGPLDYGPVIILRHVTEDGTEFFTLYGHLSRESLDGLRVGGPVGRAQPFATLGSAMVNGGWTPHLHLQIITDLLELGCDFPGVVRASERAVWRSFSPDPNLLIGIPAERFPAARPARHETLAQRGRLLGHNLSIAYWNPLRLVRGWRQYLYDDDGRRYLDAYNNVPHVGHAHPRVVRAGQRQMAVLNTNTRYLNDALIEYTERLAATLPAPLGVSYFVNSASEANELALRLARAHTRRRDMIVLEAAYHGHTSGLIDLSPYKHAGPGGAGAPEWVHVAPLPDDYRGAYRRADPEAGRKYARHVEEIIARVHESGRGLAGFIAETCPSVGGQIILPSGYLEAVYRAVRQAGGVCVADEVQTGLGRMGTHFWAFEAHGVVPDIVVLGKPLGNGHPIGAVVTTREIADSFDNGMEFFSTFGGNNVSCAIGLAVLDVLRDEGLQAHARRVGGQMLRGLGALADRFPIIGDVRGSGLFLGVELVRDRGTLEPAGEEASFVANRMRELGVLLGTDGPYHNVVKIRPPMPFDAADADRLVSTFERVLLDDFTS